MCICYLIWEQNEDKRSEIFYLYSQRKNMLVRYSLVGSFFPQVFGPTFLKWKEMLIWFSMLHEKEVSHLQQRTVCQKALQRAYKWKNCDIWNYIFKILSHFYLFKVFSWNDRNYEFIFQVNFFNFKKSILQHRSSTFMML